MPSINVETNYPEHIKTLKLKSLLGPEADCYPIRLWCLAAAQAPEDGILKGYDAPMLEMSLKWSGKPGALTHGLEASGYLGLTDNGYQVIGWSDHQGHIGFFKRRARENNAKRWGKGNHPTQHPRQDATQHPRQDPKFDPPTSIQTSKQTSEVTSEQTSKKTHIEYIPARPFRFFVCAAGCKEPGDPSEDPNQPCAICGGVRRGYRLTEALRKPGISNG